MAAKGIRYFDRWYYFSTPALADEANIALMNIASGAAPAALIEASADSQGDLVVKLLVTAGADVVLDFYT